MIVKRLIVNRFVYNINLHQCPYPYFSCGDDDELSNTLIQNLNRSFNPEITSNITIARGATKKIKKIQSLGALVYCAAPLRPQSAALSVRVPRF